MIIFYHSRNHKAYFIFSYIYPTGAVIMIIFGIFTKLGALFAYIPEPVVGGIFIVMFGMVAGIGLSNLQFVDLNSTRNLFIIGFSLFFGIQVPIFVKDMDAIKTGN